MTLAAITVTSVFKVPAVKAEKCSLMGWSKESNWQRQGSGEETSAIVFEKNICFY